MEMITLVDHNDREIGVEEKIKAHREGRLHRAFSVFVFNHEGQMLLQKRSPLKYHSRSLWTNTCCSHPRPGEAMNKAIARRLHEEMGFACRITEAFHFIYHAHLEEGLIEHEFDHVFIGEYQGVISPDPNEVADYRWIKLSDLHKEIKAAPGQFTIWFKLALARAAYWREMTEAFS
ncbi:MAG: isopentenyl-diphosphate Delta-isomerase [bacterium]